MTIQKIYNAGISLVRQLATMERNAINDDPNFDVKAYGALLDRVINFIAWTKANDKAQDLRYFVNEMVGKQSNDGEYSAMLETLDIKGVKL